LLLSAVLRPRAAAPLLVGARRQRLSIDMPARRSAANPLHAAAAVEWWDRQTDKWTDGRTDIRPLHRPSSACYANSVGDETICPVRFGHFRWPYDHAKHWVIFSARGFLLVFYSNHGPEMHRFSSGMG